MVAEMGLEDGVERDAAAASSTAAGVDWGAVKTAYEGGGDTIAEIAARFGVTRAAISWRVKTRQWRMRNKRMGASGSALLARLFRLLERQIFHLESETLEMGEKEAAVLGRVATTLEKLMQIERTSAPRRGPRPMSKDLAHLRNKIAQRLDELDRRQR